MIRSFILAFCTGVLAQVPSPLPLTVLNLELHRAAERGDTARVAILLQRGAQTDAEAPDGTTPLFRCASTPEGPKTAGLLLSRNADVNHRAKDGSTPLHAAAKAGHGPLIALLLEKGAQAGAADDNRGTPLMHLAGHPKPVASIGISALIKAGAEADARNNQGASALMLAAQKGNLETMAVLLAAGARVNAIDRNGMTPLMYACLEHRAEGVEFLLLRRANPNVHDREGRSALMRLGSPGAGRATDHVPLRILNALLKAGFDPKSVDAKGNTELHWAITQGAWGLEYGNRLKEVGVDSNALNGEGRGLIHAWATGPRDLVTLKVLLSWGQNVMKRDAEGAAAFHLFLSESYDQDGFVLDRLLEWAHPDIHAVGKMGRTALFFAIQNGQTKPLERLLKDGAKTSIRDEASWTPLTLAVHLGDQAKIRILLKAGASPGDIFPGDWPTVTARAKGGQAHALLEEWRIKDRVPVSSGRWKNAEPLWVPCAVATAMLSGDKALLEAFAAAGVDLETEGRCSTYLRVYMKDYYQNHWADNMPLPQSLQPTWSFVESWMKAKEEKGRTR